MNLLSTLIYGHPGSGKTTYLDQLADILLEAYPRKVIRLVTAEESAPLHKKIAAGTVECWRLDRMRYPFEAIRFASQGYWPLKLDDPLSKYQPPTPATWEQVSATFFEGASSVGDYLLGGQAYGGLAARTGRGEKLGLDEKTVNFQDGSILIGGNNRSQYGTVQTEVLACIGYSRQLPCFLAWTAHQDQFDPQQGNESMIGPVIVGTAKMSAIIRSFGNVLHAYTCLAPDPKGEKRLYLTDHYWAMNPTVPMRARTQLPINPKRPDFIASGTNTVKDFLRLIHET